MANLPNYPKLADTFEHQVVAAVRKFEEPADFARASDLEKIGEGIVIGFPISLEQRHPDHRVSVGDVGNHLTIARLENMQRHAQPREQHEVRQREDWDDSG